MTGHLEDLKEIWTRISTGKKFYSFKFLKLIANAIRKENGC